jgi:hypothetical protein
LIGAVLLHAGVGAVFAVLAAAMNGVADRQAEPLGK